VQYVCELSDTDYGDHDDTDDHADMWDVQWYQ